MPFLHIANTQFEWELIQKKPPSLEMGLDQHEVFLQLQFLPLLYAKPEDGVALTHLPDDAYLKQIPLKPIPHLHLLVDPKPLAYEGIEPWGYSPSVALWAEKHRINFSMPPWETVKLVNSKEFSFTNSPKLPNSALLNTEDELLSWAKQIDGPKVLKSSFGMSGRGHLIIDPKNPPPQNKLLQFCHREWKEERAVIAEPWVKRALDFSTQWKISPKKEILYIGATICENDSRGKYLLNKVGNINELFGSYMTYLEEHKKIANVLLEKIAALGFFGNVGIDSMIYHSLDDHNTLELHPIVEINARKTMGYVAIKLQMEHFPNNNLTMKYVSDATVDGLLPTKLKASNTKPIQPSLKYFSKQLIFELG